MSTVTERTWTIGQLMDWTTRYLGERGIESPHLDARVLLAKVLDCKPIDLFGTRYGDIATDEVRGQYRELIRRRLEGCPAAYLIGRKEFFSLALAVSPAVLIPRPDSEMVVVECVALAKKLAAPRILDIGTGSGNLAIALAHSLPAAQVVAVDLSQEALTVARANAERLGVAERITFLHGDLFEPIQTDFANVGQTFLSAVGQTFLSAVGQTFLSAVGQTGMSASGTADRNVCPTTANAASRDNPRFDFIVSNPPYIPHADIAGLPEGVRDYEPHLALDGGPDGFAVFDRLLAQAPGHLADGGHLIIEIGSPQETPARQRFSALPHYRLAPTVFDGSGHPRVLRAQLLN